MKILICNERFLFRFGHDRVLLLFAKYLRSKGHEIILMGADYDESITKEIANRVIRIPKPVNQIDFDINSRNWLEAEYLELFDGGDLPQIVFVGGWPFFSSISFFKLFSEQVIYFDVGAVQLDGLEGGALALQLNLRKLRKQFLRYADKIVSNSNFTSVSQSIPDTYNLVPVYPILLGSDHLDKNMWNSSSLPVASSSIVNKVKKLKDSKVNLIINLGRWEEGNYKNSSFIYSYITELKKTLKNFKVLVCSDKEKISQFKDYEDNILPLGFTSDIDLKEIMSLCNLGISVSLWEGFNLPFAEMQRLGKVTLAFDIGPHREVASTEALLCKDDKEMVEKTIKYMDFSLTDLISNKDYKNYLKFFEWERVYKDLDEVVFGDSKPINKFIDEKKNDLDDLLFIFDVTNSCRDTANSGVIRVTRRFTSHLQKKAKVVFISWEESLNQFVLLNRNQLEVLGSYNGPEINSDIYPISEDNNVITLENYLDSITVFSPWLMVTEHIEYNRGKILIELCRRKGVRLGSVFHDAIPLERPDLVKDHTVLKNHYNYIKLIANFDFVMPVSLFSYKSLQFFWEKSGNVGNYTLPNLLPGEFGNVERVLDSKILNLNDKVTILCVSTLEPRKNHKGLLKAFELLDKKHPNLDWELVLVGNKSQGADDIYELVIKATKDNKRIKYLGVVSDEELEKQYKKCTFTIYASQIEGFGMPILESLWYGKPCVCYKNGVMGEHAEDGGCLVTDVLDPERFSDDIYLLSTDKDLYKKLKQEAISRKIKSWDEYTNEFIEIISKYKSAFGVKTSFEIKSLERILYKDCLLEGWQMNDSERLGLYAILDRLKPNCVIEVGTYKAGSLSLISEKSKVVFSLDIDLEIPKKYSQFENVSFIIGDSAVTLPLLLEELKKQNLPVDLILIDGDHTSEAVKRDIDNVLNYVPIKPLIVLMHDGFNPICRSGMESANWKQCDYLHFVDLDFIPGRMVENGGTFDKEMWGGLGLFYMLPVKRKTDLIVGKSANGMYEIMKKSIYGE